MCTGTHPFIPAVNTARLELVCQAFGQTVENVFYFKKSDAWDTASLTNLATEAFAAWDDHIGPITSNAVTLLLLRATDVAVEGGAGVEVSGAGHTGSNSSSAAAPLGTTAATKFSTGLTGRSNRGRVYFIGLTKNDLANNQLTTGVPTTLTNAWTDFFGQIATELPGVEHAIVSYCHNNAWRTSAVVTPVTAYSTDPNVDSMRRRLTGRGS